MTTARQAKALEALFKVIADIWKYIPHEQRTILAHASREVKEAFIKQ
jgi:hypothetical protein